MAPLRAAANRMGEEWSEGVAHELGNYDYLMGADVHVMDPTVSAELDVWGRWYVETTGVDGLRVGHGAIEGVWIALAALPSRGGSGITVMMDPPERMWSPRTCTVRIAERAKRLGR